MIVDVNTFLGQYPFRQVRCTTAAAMIDHMEAHGITAALVGSLHAVFYRDAQRGNEELLEAIHPYPDRLFPIGTVNPLYAGWERDLRWLTEKGNVRAIALMPEHHGYRLTDDHGQAALKQIADTRLPVVLTQRLEDRRQRHHWDVAADLTQDDLVAVATAHPTLRMLLINWVGLNAEKLRAAGLRGRCLIDFARLGVVGTKDVPRLIEVLGPESIAFGSHMPFDYVTASLVKLANVAGLYADDFERIAWKNAQSFFGLPLPLKG
ncbi:MAG TPA: amidohydrolase family protein [Caulifigura sp.]|jgi:predicted TIM-barrel fold metal-dependent hydrolase|nr:amidohydrolase family protein [Caulifigura sp.]